MSELRFEDVSVRFGNAAWGTTAVDHVSLTIPSGTVVGLVGESGSGKSTLARAAVGLAPISRGRITLDGEPLARRGDRRHRIQMIFQDPSSALDPRMTVGDSVAEALPRRTTASARRTEVARLLELVQLDPAQASVFPAHLSGGQRQRIALARALASRPEVVIADEITSALDVSIQGTVINVLRDLQRELGISVLFISHNVPLVRYMTDTIAVMYMGRIVEQGPTAEVLTHPQHPYTGALLASVPDGTRSGRPESRGPSDSIIQTDGTSAINETPSGCRFHPRCPVGPLVDSDRAICLTEDASDDHLQRAACHFAPAPNSTGSVRLPDPLTLTTRSTH
jgi:peptide/nickel transport system ATP-binding protein